MNCGTKIGQTDAPNLIEWNLKRRTRLQRYQLLNDALYQRMVLSVPAGLQGRDVDLPVLRHGPRTLGFLFRRHKSTSCFDQQNTKAGYLGQVYLCN